VLLLDTSFLILYEREIAADRIGPALVFAGQRVRTAGVSLISLENSRKGMPTRETRSLSQPVPGAAIVGAIAYRMAQCRVSCPIVSARTILDCRHGARLRSENCGTRCRVCPRSAAELHSIVMANMLRSGQVLWRCFSDCATFRFMDHASAQRGGRRCHDLTGPSRQRRSMRFHRVRLRYTPGFAGQSQAKGCPWMRIDKNQEAPIWRASSWLWQGQSGASARLLWPGSKGGAHVIGDSRTFVATSRVMEPPESRSATATRVRRGCGIAF